MKDKVLVAGIGNIFLGDDAFGVEVIGALAKRRLPAGVTARDFGIRGFDLAYALLEPWDVVILVDAMSRGEAPGTLFVLEPNVPGRGNPGQADVALNPHGMDPVSVLHLAASLGEISAQVMVVGCEPHDFGDELEGRMGLSPEVQVVVEDACDLIEGLVHRLRSDEAVAQRMHINKAAIEVTR